MMRSMTAFSRFEDKEESLQVLVEIRAVNNRQLDIVLRLPSSLSAWEDRIKGLVSREITRGRIEIFFRIRDDSDVSVVPEVDEVKAGMLWSALQKLRDRLEIKEQVPWDALIRANGIIKYSEIPKDMEDQWPFVKKCFESAIRQLIQMKEREGAFIARDLSSRIDFIEKNIGIIENRSENLIELHRDKLVERIGQLLGEVVEADPDRILQEAAILADKSDISEEIVRARSHIDQFRMLMDAAEPAGRKLNFLIQEFGREFNTMASKSGSTEISHTIVNIRAELEKIREQVQNIE